MTSASQYKIRDSRESGYFQVDTEVIKSGIAAKIGIYGLGVYNVLAAYANNQTQEAYPSYSTIATHLGCSRRKVIDAIKALKDHRMIAIVERFHKDSRISNEIVLLHRSEWLPEGGESGALPSGEQDALVQDMHQGGASGAPGVVHQVHPNYPNKTILNELDSLPKGKGEKSLTPRALPDKSLEPETPEQFLVFQKWNDNRELQRRNKQKYFKTLQQKQKCQQAGERLGLQLLEQKLDQVLGNGATSLDHVINYIAKVDPVAKLAQNGAKPNATHSRFAGEIPEDNIVKRLSQPGAYRL